MGLNAKQVKGSGPKVELLEAGNYPARVVQILDLGMQARQPYNGEPKPPVNMIDICYELGTEFMKDEGGNEQLDKPRWISESMPFFSLSQDRATSTIRYKALDPNDVFDGDFTKLVGTPCTVTIVHNKGKGANTGKTYANVGNITPPMKGMITPVLVNPPKVFLLDEPDMEVFGSIPEWIQDKIKKNLEYEGSPLQKELGGEPKAATLTPAPTDTTTGENDAW